MHPPGSPEGAEIKKVAWGLFTPRRGGGLIPRGRGVTFGSTQNPFTEIYVGTFGA